MSFLSNYCDGVARSKHDSVDRMLDAWAAVRPDLELSAMGTFGRFGRVHMWASRAVEAVFERHGLSTGEFDVLAALRRSGEPHVLSPGELSRTLMLSPGGRTNRLDRLEGMGLVRRAPDPDSRRSLKVLLTPSGLELGDVVVAEHVANETALLAGLTVAQRRGLDDALRSLLASLEPDGS